MKEWGSAPAIGLALSLLASPAGAQEPPDTLQVPPDSVPPDSALVADSLAADSLAADSLPADSLEVDSLPPPPVLSRLARSGAGGKPHGDLGMGPRPADERARPDAVGVAERDSRPADRPQRRFRRRGGGLSHRAFGRRDPGVLRRRRTYSARGRRARPVAHPRVRASAGTGGPPSRRAGGPPLPLRARLPRGAHARRSGDRRPRHQPAQGHLLLPSGGGGEGCRGDRAAGHAGTRDAGRGHGASGSATASTGAMPRGSASRRGAWPPIETSSRNLPGP